MAQITVNGCYEGRIFHYILLKLSQLFKVVRGKPF